jgi:hypothetical protein
MRKILDNPMDFFENLSDDELEKMLEENDFNYYKVESGGGSIEFEKSVKQDWYFCDLIIEHFSEKYERIDSKYDTLNIKASSENVVFQGKVKPTTYSQFDQVFKFNRFPIMEDVA